MKNSTADMKHKHMKQQGQADMNNMIRSTVCTKEQMKQTQKPDRKHMTKHYSRPYIAHIKQSQAVTQTPGDKSAAGHHDKYEKPKAGGHEQLWEINSRQGGNI